MTREEARIFDRLVVGLSGHDRHLVEVELDNTMRLTIVREDDYDAVTIWSEDGESIFTSADVPHFSNVGPSNPDCQPPFAVSTADTSCSASGVRVDEGPQTFDQIVAPVAELVSRPVFSEDDFRERIQTAYEALKAYGFSPAKAAEIQLDARRGDAIATHVAAKATGAAQ